MKHKEKQKEILKAIEIWRKKKKDSKEKQRFNDFAFAWCNFGTYEQKAKEHKEEVLKGCGKDIYTGVPPRIYDCSRPCGSDPKQLCEDCQKIINKYKEIGI